MSESVSFNPICSKKYFSYFLHSDGLHALSNCLQLKPELLECVLTSQKNYHRFQIPKKKGGVRIIQAPLNPLKTIQERLRVFLNGMYSKYAPDYVNGFVKHCNGQTKKNILTNAEPHVGRAWVLNMDIEDFFPSISAAQVRKRLLEGPVQLQSRETASIVALLTTLDWQLPTGSSCSPVLSNIVFFETDVRLKALSDELGLTYTRYADDLTFSSDTMIESKTIEQLIAIIEAAGFTINRRKFRLQSRHVGQFVTGIKVNEKLNIDRGYIRNLRAILHNWEMHGINKATERYFSDRKRGQRTLFMKHAFIQSIAGRIGFLKTVKKDESVVTQLDALFTKLSDRFYYHEEHRI